MAAQPDYNLLRGQGLDLGPYVTRYAPEDRVMPRLLAERAADRPDKSWVVFDSVDHLTYGAAWRDGCRVGHALERDIGPAAHVGLMMRNQPEFVVAMYGIHTYRGICVPLNADSKGPLLHAVIEHSDIQAIVVRQDLVERLAELKDLAAIRLVVVVGDGPVPAEISGAPVVRWEEWLAGVRDDHAWAFPTSDMPCNIQYTSGTTARAKGAVIPHNLAWMYAGLCADSQERTEDDVLTAPLPLSHVAAQHIIVGSSLHAGCTGHLKSKFSASRYWQEVADDGATWGILLGPMATMILKGTKDPVPEHRLTRMFCPPPPPEWQAFERRFAPVKIIWWGYGMTEIYSMPMIDPDEQDRSLPMDTIGMPPRWIEYGVVDEADRLLPPDTPGELVFRPRIPHAMVREYYKDYDKTVEAFRNLMFHTGDMATYDEAGLIHYRGRKQERIRRRGENIAAPEVEYVALTHPLIHDAAAYGVPAEIGEEEVKLDVVLTEPVTPEELHAWLAENLPRYMVPRYLEIRESFPKTPSERVEKYKLKEQALDRPEVFDAERDRAR